MSDGGAEPEVKGVEAVMGEGGIEPAEDKYEGLYVGIVTGEEGGIVDRGGGI